MEAEQASKHDDFFDDPPEKPTMNGHISPAEPEKEQTAAKTDTAQGAEEQTNEKSGAEGVSEQEAATTGEVTEASTTEGVQATDEANAKEKAKEVDATAEAEQKQELTDEDKLASDGVDEANEVESTTVGVDTAAAENGVQGSQPDDEEKTSSTTQETEPPQATEDTGQERQQIQSEAGDVTASPTHAPSAVPSEGDIPATPAPPASRQSEYEEDFSETSSARNTPADSKAEEKKEHGDEEENKDDEKADRSSSSSSSSNSSKANTPEPQQVAVAQGVDEHTPRPSTAGGDEGALGDAEVGDRADSRAEAGQVIPVQQPEVQNKKADVDGRSSSAGGEDLQEGEAFRGEDRTEMLAPEGSEDCRGQGQWKSAEQQAISSAMLVSKSERELTEEAVKERDALKQDHEALKAQLLALEAEVDKKNEQILVDREILSRKDKEIADLQSELESSQSAMASSEADTSRQRDRATVKDLQERLAILARENEEKDKRVFKLEEELKEAQTRLRETERRLIHAENNQGQEPPKSKTCAIM